MLGTDFEFLQKIPKAGGINALMTSGRSHLAIMIFCCAVLMCVLAR